MIDVQDLIEERGGDPKKVRENLQRRCVSDAIVDEVIAAWQEARKTRYEASQFGAKINAVQKEIGQLRKNKQDAAEKMAEKTALEKEQKQVADLAAEKEKALNKKVKTIPNYTHPSVVDSDNEDHNEVVRKWAPAGVTVEKKDCLSHHEVLTRIDGWDSERGVKIAGHRGFCWTNQGYFFKEALAQYAMHFLYSKHYRPCQPPYFMSKEYMGKTAQLEQFDEELYKVVEGDDVEDKYLIATSEQPLTAMHADEWMTDKDLPIKYAGVSTCFRKEAGSHGKDAWGTFRVHQFKKVEQLLFVKPEDSWQALEDMLANSEEFYQSLKLPYHVVTIVSGALNNAAAKKYDLEAWFPYQGEYKELVSCSNCTDYQTRELETRYGQKKGGGEVESRKKYVHCLNGTLCAVERTVCCVLENYQKEDGVEVPEVLRRFIPGEPAFLPYVKELPKDSTSQKSKSKPKADGVPAGGPKLNPPKENVADKMKDMKV